MSRFIFCTDQHFRAKTPVNRIDNILDSLIRKMDWVIDYAIKKKANAIIMGGDLFHVSSPSDIVANKVKECLRRYDSYYYIIGNHDVIGNNPSNADKCKIGLFSEFDWFNYIGNGHQVIEFSDCCLHGIDHCKEMECPNNLMLKDKLGVDSDKPLMVVVHSMIIEGNEIIIGGKKMAIDYRSITTDADIILTGHYHPGFGIKENSFGTIFVNPGAMMRQGIDTVDQIPSIADIKIGKKIEVKIVHIDSALPKANCFDLKKIQNKIKNESEKNLFMKALDEMSGGEFMSQNVETALENLRNKDNEKIVERCKKKIKEIVNVRD